MHFAGRRSETAELSEERKPAPESPESKIGKTEPGVLKNPDGSEVEYRRGADGKIRPEFIRRPDGSGSRFAYDKNGTLTEVSQVRRGPGGSEELVERMQSNDGKRWQKTFPEQNGIINGEFSISHDGSYSFSETANSWNPNPKTTTRDTNGNLKVADSSGKPIYESVYGKDGSFTQRHYFDGKLQHEVKTDADKSRTITQADGSFIKSDSMGRLVFQHKVNEDGSYVDLAQQGSGRLRPVKVHYSDGSERSYKYAANDAYISEISHIDKDGKMLAQYKSNDARNYTRTAGDHGPNRFFGLVTVDSNGVQTQASQDKNGKITRFVTGMDGKPRRSPA